MVDGGTENYPHRAPRASSRPELPGTHAPGAAVIFQGLSPPPPSDTGLATAILRAGFFDNLRLLYYTSAVPLHFSA